MKYTIKALANLAGISTRTLRWYDEIGLLTPSHTTDANYRIYDEASVTRLQQIMFCRELEFPLSEIARILDAPDFDHLKALQSHRTALAKRRERIDALILTINRMLSELQGGGNMTDQEKFEAFKAGAIQENEEHYGEEIRRMYGDAAVDAANDNYRKLDGLTHTQREETKARMFELLEAAVQAGESPPIMINR